MKNKLWTGIITGAVTVSMLAGCGTGGGTEGGGASAGAGPVTIKFHSFGSEQQQAWSKVVAAFQEKNPNIKVEIVNLSEKGDTQEYAKKLDLAAASGEEMDVMMFSEPGMYAQRYFALPGKFNPWYVLLNKDHLKEAGLEVPKDWTYDQFMEYAKKLTKGDGPNKRYGTYFHGPQGGGWLEFSRLAMANQPDNSDYLKADGTSNLDNPLFRKSIEMRYQMEKVDKSATPYTDTISQKLHYRPQFFNQSASMIVIGSWMNSELGGTDQFPLNFNVAVAPFPKNTASDPSGYSMVTTDFMAVAANSKHKEEAYKFVRYLTTDGILAQGKYVPSWTKVKNEELGTIVDTILAGTKSPDKVDKESLKAVLMNSRASKLVPPTSYQADVYKVINEEYEKLILDKQNLDAMIKNAQERTQKIIDSNKK
ncbi:MAG: extracellular solute-binding protein family 1 [Paenibacillus sp.]|nr:extracellular solute-binding protein family 1 [Paenibacillus sp.]